MCQEFLQKAWDAKHEKDYAAAEANYRACLKCNPENAEALRELGLMCRKLMQQV
jgi:methylphosphotriester-DNA--protein-cysteine methyltransferase